MSSEFRWIGNGERSQRFVCESFARSWVELKPALIAGWIKFCDVLLERVAEDVRNEINLAFFASSGRIVFNHGERAVADDLPWQEVPTDYIWTVTVRCPWVERSWEEEGASQGTERQVRSGTTGVLLASACLQAATSPEVIHRFTHAPLGDLVIRGGGVTQSPAPFVTKLSELFASRLPNIT